LNQDSYKPGDTISGRIDVRNSDGSPFDPETPLTYSYTVDFQSETQEAISVDNQPLSEEGSAFFNIRIPQDTKVLLSTISFQINYGSIR
jgi:hypothetical protein